MERRTFVYLCWGETYLHEACKSAASVRRFSQYDIVLITDRQSAIPDQNVFTEIVRTDFELQNLCRKSEMLRLLPERYTSFCFLDTDTVLLMEVNQGFDKSEQFGIAAAPAPHYSLEHFWGFGSELEKHQTISKSMIQYNTGVIFFSRREAVWAVLAKWYDLCKNSSLPNYEQPYFTLAMEELGFNPYTLSINYNYRNFGEIISGDVRIWHSHILPPDDVNNYKDPWPPRRYLDGRRIEPEQMSAIPSHQAEDP